MDAMKAIQNLYPHYTNKQFEQAQTVYLADGYKLNKDGVVGGAEYNYSDRLWQWDYEKAQSAWEAVKAQDFVRDSATQHEAFLSAYWGKPCKLVHVLAGFNWSSGHPYQVYGAIFESENSENKS